MINDINSLFGKIWLSHIRFSKIVGQIANIELEISNKIIIDLSLVLSLFNKIWVSRIKF